MTKDWKILCHLCGNRPWVEKVVDAIKDGIAVPEGCRIEQVQIMARHAERYPTVSVAGVNALGTGNGRICDDVITTDVRNKGFSGENERVMSDSAVIYPSSTPGSSSGQVRQFLQSPPLPQSSVLISCPDDLQIEQLTLTIPFSGSMGAFATSVRLKVRYVHLLAVAQPLLAPTRFWSSDSQRVIDTERYFGLEYTNTTALEDNSEASHVGGDTLTPGDTCWTYCDKDEKGQGRVYTVLIEFCDIYLGRVGKRLLEQNLDTGFTNDEIDVMQEMCGLKTTMRGGSRWCDVFTQDEFRDFGSARDLLHYYRAGPETKYAAAIG